MRKRIRLWLVFLLLATFCVPGESIDDAGNTSDDPEVVHLQRAIPFGIFNRVFGFQYGKELGTCFVVEVDGRQYVITARHLVAGIEEEGGSVKIFMKKNWQSVRVTPIFPALPKTDIVALAPSRVLAPKMEITAGAGGIFIGQDVYFLGFPFGLATRGVEKQDWHLAFVKKAILSAIDSRPESGHILYLDGHNNAGFSGGPVIFANYAEGDRLQIAGVVSAYRNQPTLVETVVIEEPESQTAEKKKQEVRFVRENTGIVIAYSFVEIEKAIRARPIGPLLEAPAGGEDRE